jgi:hypothetical protein
MQASVGRLTNYTSAARRFLLSSVIIAIPNARLQAQEVKVMVPADNVVNATAGTCQIDAPPAASVQNDKALHIFFVDNNNAAKAPGQSTVIQVNGVDRQTIKSTVADAPVEIGREDLVNSNVTILRENPRTPICSMVPLSVPPPLLPNSANYTSFVADGEVGKVLRGATSGGTTGSLGIDHNAEHPMRARTGNMAQRFGNGVLRVFPWWAKGEHLTAVITIAGSADSLFSDRSNTYGAAMLLPSIAGNGSLQGTTVDYHWYYPLGTATGTFGPIFRFTTTRSFWVAIDTVDTGTRASPGPPPVEEKAPTIKTFRQPLPLSAIDLGIRFTFINHPEDTKQNTYAMGIDPKWVWRIITPNTQADRDAVQFALCRADATCHAPRKVGGPAIALWIRLRQVTATAPQRDEGPPDRIWESVT